VENEVLYTLKEERNILHVIKGRKVNWLGHILRGNCLLKHITEGKIEGRIEVTGRRGRRRKHLLDDIKEKERGSTALQSVQNSLSKKLWTCRKTD
jgi:hypothetical protein